ncbi:bifunctional UDP-N-acetylglucosamine diphosphorylase/glucosamine-1-phosphate N-acetyltransferase GlmU [Cytobacillus sp. IB215665]|uniref:bifunctional UDP-N-acetylglucosamine diphosphorylase/glucosamine-1-phosphate N-acetyltransferase GlmU n=1 Tax=Cytobacillus sp. IB215665 TaxID=3097357 RepID=UPI002A1451E1|nr:bifunctional UDP-N-acetylglucosamine diphosphorylase/glucosamine-1-phosphate N-acetyltransferase GlmU [Cytobacillus sp. IB215665]MDX8367626.1 bifunctional UDP-N-acetylglucosamine diphosphorylase/glucosamine-1-phosphate N-acetyltransferase GlmU [Cytobacillus sp. IB215665]
MKNRFAVILAAGQGTRMKSKLYKVLHPVCGKPMVQHVVEEVTKIGVSQLITVVGHGAEQVKEKLGNSSDFVLQKEQLGTGHAVLQAAPQLEQQDGITIVLYGDTPLITEATMKSLLEHHEHTKAKVTILTAIANDPTGYGRIVRDDLDKVEKIVEHKDANDQELSIKEINTGIYCFDNKALFHALKKVSNNNSQGEYYLPDVVGILKNEGETVSVYQTQSFSETLGVNNRIQLAEAEQIMKERINNYHMLNGVTIIDPHSTYISSNAQIGQDTIIHPGTIIEGETVIGTDCTVGPHTELKNCQIGNRSVIRHSVAHQSEIGNEVNIGPFAHIRPDSLIKDEVKIGNFVEVKKSIIGDGSKASHLSYIGDAEVGKGVNIGCGSITVNYDGQNKYLTKIEDGAFIGCNSNLVAPVTVGERAYVAAGSTITKDVPGSALSIARAQQVNKEQYVNRLREKK